uniref:Uncharacterized protein n=1 Tax=Spongospora subterranea TaxID=70186 RepID=A0A0H5R7T9_9EUKA|eukprot:CRZ09876.1 hypothetical protein [Spongospora subterranea]
MAHLTWVADGKGPDMQNEISAKSVPSASPLHSKMHLSSLHKKLMADLILLLPNKSGLIRLWSTIAPQMRVLLAQTIIHNLDIANTEVSLQNECDLLIEVFPTFDAGIRKEITENIRRIRSKSQFKEVRRLAMILEWKLAAPVVD